MLGRSPTRRRRTRVAALVSLALTAVACGDSGSTSSSDPTPASVDVPDRTEATEPAVDDSPSAWTPPAGTVELEFPDQPRGVPFPTEEWPTGDLPRRVDRAAIDRAVQAALREPDDPAHVRSIVIVHRGRLVYEAYHSGLDAQSVNTSYSVAKSVASAGIGMLAGDGIVDVDGPAPVTGWTDDRAAITVEDLLHMASGLEWDEVYEPGAAPFEMLAAPDASDSAAGHPLVAEPGTTFNYSTGTSAILAQIITDAAWAQERGAAVDPAAEPDPDAGVRFLTTRLFEPLGITSVQLQRDPEGTWLGGLGANMTSRDFARFGLLYMRDGVWDGDRILPDGWVDYSFTPSPASEGYGAQWWLSPEDGRYDARGLFGQVIALVPDEDLVVVVNSEPGGPADKLVDRVIAAFVGR